MTPRNASATISDDDEEEDEEGEGRALVCSCARASRCCRAATRPAVTISSWG